MDIDKIIKEKFGSLAVGQKAGELLFRQPEALEIINYCEKNNIIIVGMNFWKQKGEDIIEINSTNYKGINIGPEASNKTSKASETLIKEGLPDDANYASFVLSY